MKVNVENFVEKARFNLKRKAKTGFMIASTILVVGSSITGCNSNKSVNSELDSMVTSIDAGVSLDDINEMDIIINDNDCSDTFFDEVCNNLKEDGIKFNITKNNEGINDGSVVITLDQQYSSGSDTIIFAPYNNTRIGYSDSLALSMQAAFKQNGFLGNKISCGKIGYREDEKGNISTSIPTETEEILDADSDVSFVTISFGTQNLNSEWVSKSIENGLARQKYYLDNYDAASDLIYRASINDSIEIMAAYFNTSVSTLNNYNGINGKVLFDSQAIVNPEIENMEVFNQNSRFSIDNVKTRAY